MRTLSSEKKARKFNPDGLFTKRFPIMHIMGNGNPPGTILYGNSRGILSLFLQSAQNLMEIRPTSYILPADESLVIAWKMVKPLDYVIEHLGTCRARVRRDRGRGVRWPDSPVPSIHLFKTLSTKTVMEVGTTIKSTRVIIYNH